MRNREEYFEVDLFQILQALWRRVWLIVLAMVLCGSAAFCVTRFLITPKYSSRILMYVNNQNGNDNKQSISQGDLVAAQGLVDTYKVILRSQSTLNEVIKQAELPYTAGELNNMISADSVDATEVFYVEVVRPDAKEAAQIANVIGQVLPKRISAIVDGSSVRLVDYAEVAKSPSSPNSMRNTVLGAVLGAILACVIIVIDQLTDDKISGPDYLAQNYQIPVLAVIPDLMPSKNGGSTYQGGYRMARKER